MGDIVKYIVKFVDREWCCMAMRRYKPQVCTKEMHIGDIVKFVDCEWCVTDANGARRTLQRLAPGAPSTCIALDTQLVLVEDWRSSLQPGDVVDFWYKGNWIQAHVIGTAPSHSGITLQPVFTHSTITVGENLVRRSDYANVDANADLVTPLQQWVVSTDPLRHRCAEAHGQKHVVEKYVGDFVRTTQHVYLPRSEVTLLPKVPDEYYRLGCIPFRHDTHFSDNDSILGTMSHISRVAHDIACCAKYTRVYNWQPKYGDLNDMVLSASLNGDEERVRELISIVGHTELFFRGLWFEHSYAAASYIRCQFHDDHVELFAHKHVNISHRQMLLFVAPIMERLCTGKPRVLIQWTSASTSTSTSASTSASSASTSASAGRLTAWQNIAVERMLTMEHTPTVLSLAVKGTSLLFHPHNGVHTQRRGCRGHRGGVLAAAVGLGKTWMMLQTMRHNPVHTLVVLSSVDDLHHWIRVARCLAVPFTLWHGAHKDATGMNVFTTSATLCRSPDVADFNPFKRVVLDNGHMVRHNSRTMQSIPRAPIRWYLSAEPNRRGYCAFLGLTKHSLSGVPRAFLRSLYHTAVLRVSASAVPLQRRPVQRSTVTFQPPACYHIVGRRIRSKQKLQKLQSVIQYMPKLVPPELLHQHVPVETNTLAHIAEVCHVTKKLLDDQAEDKCPVCLQAFTATIAVSTCGHMYCSGCIQQLKDRNINCAMCRSPVDVTYIVGKPDATLLTIGNKKYKPTDATPGDMLNCLLTLDDTHTVFCTSSSVVAKHLVTHVQGTVLTHQQCKQVDWGTRVQPRTLVLLDRLEESEKSNIVDRIRTLSNMLPVLNVVQMYMNISVSV
jgi:hypothetical protein